jgi:hypothetical protein
MPMTFCPSCEQMLPPSSFLDTRADVGCYGAYLRCIACIRFNTEASRWLSANRDAAKADQTSPLAAVWLETRRARARSTRAAYLYAKTLLAPAFSPALVAA